MIINYRSALDGYIFGNKKWSRNLRFDNCNRPLDLKCKFCNSNNDNVAHIVWDCKFTKKIIKELEIALKTKFHEDAVIFNENTKKIDWLLMSIMKKGIIKHKIALDIENVKVGNVNLAKKNTGEDKKKNRDPLTKPAPG